MYKRNQEIREVKGNIPYWVIADHIGIHENTLHNWMKTEMEWERKNKILTAIAEVKEKTNSGGIGDD